MDIKDREARSKNMSAIRSKDTKPEMFFRKLLFQNGFRYRKNVPTIEGKPDIFLKKYNTAIFVHGCYWHRHSGCKFAYMPKSRIDFWEKKFQQNIERDSFVRTALQSSGIKCLVVWECTIKAMMKSETSKAEVLRTVDEFLHSPALYMEI